MKRSCVGKKLPPFSERGRPTLGFERGASGRVKKSAAPHYYVSTVASRVELVVALANFIKFEK